ncbi:MAG: beta strand repeat-containing protein, partial [Pirellulales bacterium]
MLSSVGLGTAANFAVLGVDHSTIAISGSNTTINGNLGLGPNGTQNFSTGTINGNYDVDPTADNTHTNSVAVAASTSVTDLSGAVADAETASTAIAGMTATQSLGAITGSSTITGDGGVNVIDVSSISLSGTSSLNLSGGPNDVFYINDPGDFVMTDSSTIGGVGVTPSQVIFNITGSGNAVSFSGSSVGGGTFLAIEREIDVAGAIVNGAMIGGENANVSLTADAEINYHEFVPPSTSPTMTTSAGNSVVLGSGMNLSDTATLSGASSPTGTVTFYLFAPGVTPNASDSNNVYSDTVTVSGNGSYGTSSGTNAGGYLPTAIGTYQWVAVYSGDTNNQSVSGNYGDEPQDVVSPAAISTFEGDTLQLGSGNKLYDSAELIGGISPTGTITFYLFAPGVTPNATDSNNIYSDTVTVNGDNTYDITMGTNPGGYLPTAAGTYQWVALYSGDANNPPAASEFGDEPQKVVPPAPTITTHAGNAIVLGSGAVLTDSATLSGGVNPTGTVTFYLFAPGVTPNATDSNNIYSDSVTVTGNGTYTTSMGNNPGGYLPSVVGAYQWIAVYSGDANNQSATSGYGNEPEVVAPSAPTITTNAGGTVVLGSGDKLSDSATLSGGTSPTGTITFYLFAPGVTPNATDSNNVYSDAVSVTGDGTYSTASGSNSGGLLPTVAGTYQWVAVYSGDLNNQATASNVGDEPEQVSPTTPAVATTPGGTVLLGSGDKLNDSATLSGGTNPTGTITFYLFAP